MKLTVTIMSVLLIITALTATCQATCKQYGHSCYGGHGKRSDVKGYPTPTVTDYQIYQPPNKNQIYSPRNRNILTILRDLFEHNRQPYNRMPKTNYNLDIEYPTYNELNNENSSSEK